jgi:hypothetical protein
MQKIIIETPPGYELPAEIKDGIEATLGDKIRDANTAAIILPAGWKVGASFAVPAGETFPRSSKR